VEGRYEEVKGLWEERFETSYGRWRGFVDAVVYAFLDCGDLEQGFARVFCDTCKREYLLAFSCSRRGFCPSCAAKRGVIFGAFLREEVVEEVGHCLWTFTVPKLLRPYFLHRRKLLGKLCHAAWETVAELIAAAATRGVRPGMVAAVHTASSDLRWHPHVHALASRGGWDRAGVWHPVPYVDTYAAELLFRQKVISFLVAEDLLNGARIELLNSWKCGHTGFSAHNAVTVQADDHDGIERLARYLLRPPLSLERLSLEPGLARYRHKRALQRGGEPFDPEELLARMLMHVPAPRLHLVRYYGHYAHVCRARRRSDTAALGESVDLEESSVDNELPSAARRHLKLQWAQLIRRIYEADPLLCGCGAQMRILSFITDPKVARKIRDHLQSTSTEPARGPPLVDAELAEPSALVS
jgi:hypothetical protein